MSRTLKLICVGALALSLVEVTVPTTVPIVSAATPFAVVESNIDCAALTPAVPYGVKAQFGAAGTYALPNSGGGTATIDPNDHKVFTWSSDYPVDAVIVFGGSAANVYKYDNSFGDASGLTSPGKKNSVPDISHVWFCHDASTPISAAVGAASVAGARGVALSDIASSVLNVSDQSVLDAVYRSLAGTGPFRGSGSLSFRGSGSLSFRGSGSLSFRGSGSLSFRGSGNLGFRGSGSLSFRGSGAFRGSDLFRAVGTLGFRGSGAFRGSTLDGAVLQTPLSGLELDILETTPGPDGTYAPVLDETGRPITWERILRGTVFEGFPLQSVTMLDVVGLLQQATDSNGDGLLEPSGLQYVADASIFDLDATGVMLSKISLLSLLLINTPLVTLSSASATPPIQWCTLSAPYTQHTCLVGTSDAAILPDATLFELAMYGVPGSIVPLDDILMAPLRTALAQQPGTKGPLALALAGDYDGDGVADGDPVCATSTTLGQCLAEIITPKDFPWEDLPVESLALDGFALGQRLPVTATFSVAPGGTVARLTLPAGFVYDAGTGTDLCRFGTCTRTAPASVGTGDPQVLTYGPSNLPTGMVQLRLSAAPKGLVSALPGQLARVTGPAGPVTLAVTSGIATQQTISAGVTVTDPWAGQPTAVPDTIYFGSLAAGEIDPYELRLPADLAGSTLAVRLRSLTAGLDGDLALLSPSPEPSMSGAAVTRTATARGTSTEPIDDPGTGSSDLPPETLQDIPTTPADPAFPLLADVGGNRGRTDEVATTSEASTTADSRYLVQVSAFNGSSGSYSLRVIATPSGIAACPVVAFHGTIGDPTRVSTVTDPQSLIVYNTTATSAALLGTNGDDGAATLFGLARATHAWLLPVTPAADQSWTHPTSGADCVPAVANATVEAIAGKIRLLRAGTSPLGAMPVLDTVVLVGSDDRLPFYRNADTTSVFNEDQHADAVGTDNPVSHSQLNRYFLSDDPYGTLQPIPWLERSFHVPDLAVGRLVETDTEIRQQIAQYLDPAVDGSLTPATALVAGYDFLADGADSIAHTLSAAAATTTLVDQPGATTPWRAQTLLDLLQGDPGIASLNAHFSQWELLSSYGDARQTYDAFDAGDVAALTGSALTASVLFSAGCHAGMSVPDSYATDYPLLPGAATGIPLDWAQTLARRSAAVWVANTGYGYGAVGDVGLTERLMALYAKYLIAPTTKSAGQALMLAKQEYFASQGVYGSYDEKALQQVVFYGIPNFRLGAGQVAGGIVAAAGAAPATSAGAPIVAGSDGMPAAATIPSQGFMLEPSTVDGRTSYSSAGETLSINGYPVVPRTSIDVTATGGQYEARGAVIESLNTTMLQQVLPRIARATADSATDEPAIQPSTVVFPTAFQSVAGTSRQQRLVVYPGQFSDLDPAPGANAGDELLLNRAGFTVYYADTTTGAAGDVTRPFVQESTAAVGQVNGSPGVVLFRVKAIDPAGVNDAPGTNPTAVQRVLVQYDDDPDTPDTAHDWVPVELHQELPSGLWVGALATTRTGGKYIVQAVDGAGNVAYSSFKGVRYQTNGASPNAVAVVTDGVLGGDGWYTSAVVVSLYIAGRPATAADGYSYRIGQGSTPVPYSAPFDVPDGISNLTFVPPAGSAVPPALTVKKDTGRPTVTLHDAIEVVAAGTAVPTPTCTASDPAVGQELTSGPGGCTIDPDATTVAVDGTDYFLASGRATDVAGNVSPTASQTAVVIDGVKNPDGSFSAANRVTVVAGGTLYRSVVFEVGSNGEPLTAVAGILDPAQPLTTRLPTFEDPGSYNIRVTVPGSGADAGFSTTFTVVVDDRIPPAITTVPPPGPVEATGPGGAAVVFSATAVDDTDGPVPVTCSPSSGSTFPLGTTSVVCTAADRVANTARTSFDVVVRDTTTPTLSVPGTPVAAEATGPAGAAVTFAVSAVDAVSGAVSPLCTDGSGSVVASGTPFPLGTTTVTCTATDAAGNTSPPRQFTVTVRDTTAPALGTPANLTAEGNTAGGAFVPYTPPTATDIVSGAITATCTPGSGSMFPLGTTVVTCTATDAAGNSAGATFTVTVADTRPPVLTVPSNDVKVKGTSSAGAVVVYSVSAVDVDAVSPVTVACTPASGTLFPYGATTVGCTATDGAGNVTAATFRVVVIVAYNYNGFFSPVNMSTTTTLPRGDGLSAVVNSVNGGRNVPMKWEVFDSVTLARMTDITRVKVDVMRYSDFRTRFGPFLPGSTLPLPANACAQGRPVIPVSSSSTGKTTTVKLTNGQFNVGQQMPVKPAADNCFVVWTSYGPKNVNLPTGGTPEPPGIAALFVMT